MSVVIPACCCYCPDLTTKSFSQLSKPSGGCKALLVAVEVFNTLSALSPGL